MPLPLWMIKSLAALFPTTHQPPRRPLAAPRSRKMRLEVLENRSMLTVLAMDDTYEVLHDQVLSGGSVLDNDSQSEFEQLVATLVSGPSEGTLNFGSGGNFTYTPPANFAGPVTFTYSASFGSESDQASVTINVTNNAPVPSNGNESVLHDQTLSSYVSAYDLDGDNLTYALAAGPYQGTIVLDAWGALTYTPLPSLAYYETFTFTVTDQVATATGTFTVNVTNNAPVAYDDTGDINRNETISYSVSAYDLDGDTVIYSVSVAPSFGTLTFDPGTGSFTYTPNSGYGGPDQFEFTATDGVDSDTGTFTINVNNTAPIADDGWADVDQDGTLTGTVTAYDLDGDTLQYSVVSSPAHGSLALAAGGTFTYTPMTGYVGPDVFIFSASDGLADDTGTFYIDVLSDEGACETSCGGGTTYTVTAVIDGDETGRKPAGFTIQHNGSIAIDHWVQFAMSGEAVLNTGVESNADYGLADAYGNLLPLSWNRVTIKAGTDSVTVLAIPIHDNNDNEGDETVTMTLEDAMESDPTSSATAVIHDAAVTVTATKATVNEGDAGTFSFIVKRWGATDAAMTVNLSVTGTAEHFDDYKNWPTWPAYDLLPTSVVIPAGKDTKTLTFKVVDDGLREVPGEETVIVTLNAGTGYNVHSTQGTATTTIVDDDDTPLISITPSNSTINEVPNDTAQLTVSRSGSTEFPLTISLVIDGTATRGGDYVIEVFSSSAWQAFSGLQLSFAPNETTRSLRVKPIHDTAVEAPPGQPEEFVTISAIDGGMLYGPASSDGTGQVTIIDNDGYSTGWYLDVGPMPVPAPDYTEWELKAVPTTHNVPPSKWYFERQKVIASYEAKQNVISFAPSPQAQAVTAAFSWSQGTTVAVGGEFTTGVDQTLIKDWFTVGATLSGNLSYTVSEDQQSTAGLPISLLPGQAGKAVPMVLVIRTIRQVTAVSSSSSNRPPEGTAGDSAVVVEESDVFRYGFYDWWSTSTLEIPDHVVYVWKTVAE